jgi:hypothetical protein
MLHSDCGEIETKVMQRRLPLLDRRQEWAILGVCPWRNGGILSRHHTAFS